jgi:hypothetical protein
MTTPDGQPGDYPALVTLRTNKPRFVHRRGSNVTNGAYYFDDNSQQTIIHSKQLRKLDVEGLRARYLTIAASQHAKGPRDSPLFAPKWTHGKENVPRFFTGLELPMSDMTLRLVRVDVSAESAEKLVRELNEAGYWPAKLERISNPYRGPGPREIAAGDFSETEVGDDWDTSPFKSDDAPLGISTRVFVRNLYSLVRYVDTSR